MVDLLALTSLDKLLFRVRCRLTNTMLADSHFDQRGLTDSTNLPTGAYID
jgi:hypothetical protein